MVPKICRIFCATANPTNVIVTQTEHDNAIKRRKDLWQRIVHKLQARGA
jgi:adenosine/AMP kinase